jgi:hypothetical protein
MAEKLTPAQRLMAVQIGSLTGQTYANFNSIINKYPGMSKDLVMSMVRQGFNANTPGIDKITTMDGLAALKADAVAIDEIKSTVKPDRGILGTIQNAFDNIVYDPFKGLTRLTFATLSSPYEMVTGIARDVVAITRGEKGAGQQLLKDLGSGIFGQNTKLGQIFIPGNAGGFSFTGGLTGQGEGFFVSPETTVGLAQAKSMQQYGKINGKSFTIGRGIFSGVGMNPNSNAYSVSSGFVDAVLNVAADPTTWFGPGAVGKIITGGSKATALTKDLAQVNKAGFDIMAKESLDELEKTNQIVRDKLSNKISSPYKRYASQYKKKEQEIIAKETEITDTQVRTFRKLLNTSKDIYAWEGVDKAADAVLSPNALAKWFVENPTVQTGELSKAIGLLSADMKNTGGFFDGFLIMDEVPNAGKISIGVHTAGNVADEFAVTLKAGKELKLLDMSDTFLNADEKTRFAENLLRAKFADELDKMAKGAPEVEFRIMNELSSKLREDSANLDGFVGSLFSIGDELTAGKSLGTLIGEIAQYKNPAVMSKIADLVQNVWKVDGFTNIRSIYGGTGGVVVTNTKRLAAKSAQFGNAAAEVLDPTDLGPNIIKLLDSVKGSKEELARLQNELDDTLNKTIDLKDKENWFNMLREKANGDPDMLKELIQDPSNAGIKNLLKMELEISTNNVFKESIMAQIGITDNFMGEVLDTPNVEKALKFVLGRQFQPIAELIAKETDPVRLRRLFNRKLDDNMIKELTLAQSVDDVYKIMVNQFVPGGDPIKIKQALSAGVKIATNPVARMVPGVNLNAVRYAENINKAFGRFYIRSTALNLNDLTALNNGVEDWISSVGIKRIIGKNTQEKIINETQQAIFKAVTNAERGKAVATGIGKIMAEVGSTLGLPESVIDELKNVAKINGKEEAILKSYAADLSVNNSGGAVLKAGDTDIRLEKGILEFQLASDVINLPDSRSVSQAVIKHKTNLPLFGQAKSAKILLEEANDLWRTGQLVGRASYVFRNIAEMQMRQFFSGHNSIFNNPVGFISMVMANPEGNAFQKALAQRSKYGVNVLGDWVKSTDAEVELSASIIARRGLMRGTSVGDYGSSGRKANMFKAYQAVGTEHPDYLQGLAWTINSFSADKFFPDVIRVLEKGTPNGQIEYVDNLIATFDEPGNKLKEFVSAIYDNNEGMRQVLLKNPGLETGPGIVKENMNKDNILLWLFDETQPSSYAGQLNTVAGQGSQRNAVIDLIRDGEALITGANGKVSKINTPYRIKGLTTEQVLAAEKSYTARVAAIFKPEQLQGSVVTNVIEKSIGEGAVKKGKEFTDWFFNLAARGESAMNFGPEFDASYWDYIAGYADMLDTADLKTLLRNANKALAPTSKGGRKILGRTPGALRVINKTIKDRLKNPDYVHQGGASLKTLDGIAADQASEYVKNLFYDAAKQKQWANAVRIVAPFAQAHYNTLNKWGQLTWSNPVPIYKFGKAYDALTKEGTNVIYNVAGMTYDDQQGFIYKDEQTQQMRFKMPIAGTVLGALAGRNLNMKDALQITTPVESLNLAFGSLNPVIPGIGPALVGAYELTGRGSAFGPVDDVIRDIITPFGEPKTLGDIIFPAWLKKTSNAVLGNDATTLRGVKDWASYLASTGEYGDNPFADDAERVRLFNDAHGVAKWAGIWGGIFQSISPSVPIDEILVNVKNPNNKQNFMTMTMLYSEYEKLKNRYPGDQTAAVTKFADTFGWRNILIAISGTTPGSTGATDAWTFLNNNPGVSDKYARPNEDVIPYLFPGGEYSQKYYNWQLKTGARRKMSTVEIMQESEGMVYAMLKSQIAEKQIAGLYTADWYTEQIAILNKQFGGAKPVDNLVTGVSDARIAVLEKALLDPAIQSSPVYKQISEFYPVFRRFKDSLNQIKVSNYAELSSKGGLPTLMRNELVALGEKLMKENPEFTRMYYGLFAGILKESD